MVRIKVLKASKYAIDGIKVMEYGVGEHDVEKECADIFCKEGWAEMVAVSKSDEGNRKGRDKGRAR